LEFDKGSRDGFGVDDFHIKCDKKPNTLVIIKSEHGNIFGGYTEQDWTPTEGFKRDEKSFIFSLINKDNKPLKLKCQNYYLDIYCGSDYGPTFGKGPGFRIAINSDVNSHICSLLGSTSNVYRHPHYADLSPEAKSFLAFSENFKVLDIEVYIL